MFEDTPSATPTLHSTVASKQQKEMDLNYVLATSFSHFPEDKCTVKGLLFAFISNATCHVYLREHEQGAVLHAPRHSLCWAASPNLVNVSSLVINQRA